VLCESDRPHNEPIAVVGLSCRFPGGKNPAAFWDLLAEGRDAVREVPADRWDADAFFSDDPGAAGRAVARRGGFLDRVDGFDARFFGISPREATAMDPQQRLVLELAWEALENAGTVPDRLRGSRAGVFVGAMADDYATLVRQAGVEAVGTFTSTENGFTGSIRTLALNVKACIARVENPSDKGPQFRVYAGSVELARPGRRPPSKAAPISRSSLTIRASRLRSTQRSPKSKAKMASSSSGPARTETDLRSPLRPATPERCN